MKFIHIADVHLGAQPDAGRAYSKERPRELWDALERVLDVCEEEQTDLLLIAGYLFHRQPLLRELKELDYRSEEHTSELQSRFDLVCRLLLEKKKKTKSQ